MKRQVKAVRTAPEVFCAFDEMRSIGELVPHPMNPNTHPQKQVEMLAEIIAAQGWRAPITVSERSGYVVRGHGRLLAARELELDEVPIDLQPYDSEASEYADLVADNRIAELAEIDEDQLAKTLRAIGEMGMNLDLAGFDAEALSNLRIDDVGESKKRSENISNETDNKTDYTLKYSVIIVCANESDQTKLLERLIEEGFECRALML